MFCISMFKDALEKANILDLPTPKNVSFEGKIETEDQRFHS